MTLERIIPRPLPTGFVLAGALALTLALVLAACEPPPPGDLPANHAPVARLLVPQLWPAAAPVVADARLSDDADGDALRFTMLWGDGTPAAEDDDGLLEHTYAAPGTFAVELTVTDEDGIPSRVQASVVVVGDDDALCSCELGCFDDAVCTARGCLLFRSARADEAAPAGAFDDALRCS
jgi:hypothetical protein